MLSKTRRALEDFDNQHEFERMAADVLNALGYSNVEPMAPRGGSDGAGQFIISVVPAPVEMSQGSARPKTVALALSFFFEDGDLIAHDVFIGAPQDLRSLCEKIVARFDVAILQPKREGKR